MNPPRSFELSRKFIRFGEAIRPLFLNYTNKHICRVLSSTGLIKNSIFINLVWNFGVEANYKKCHHLKMLNKSLMLLMLQIGALELHLVPLLVTTFDHPDQADQLDKLDKLRKNLKTSRNLISLKNWPTWPTWLTWPTKLTNLEKLTNLKNLTKMLNPTWARPWPTSPDLPPAIAILISFQSSLLLGNFPFNLFCCWEIRKKVCNPLGAPLPPTHTVLPILTSNTSSIHNITFQLTDFQRASLHCIFHEILLQNWLPERQQ